MPKSKAGQGPPACRIFPRVISALFGIFYGVTTLAAAIAGHRIA